MTTLVLSAKLNRSESSTPWGFRLHGGKDFNSPLIIQKVNAGSLASRAGVKEGDFITKIGDVPTDSMMHKDAQQQILRCGNNIELQLQRGGGGPRGVPQSSYNSYLPAAPPPQQNSPSSYQQTYNSSPRPFGSPNQYKPASSYGSPMDNLASNTGSISISEPVPPWQSGGGYSKTSGFGSTRGYGGAAPISATPGVWKPQVPTGDRHMRLGRLGDAKSMTGMVGGRIPICGSCGMTIRGPFITAMDNTWCPNHFSCANPHCARSLMECGFVEERGQLYCERDYEQYFAPRCKKCSSAIMGDCVNALRATYHPHCFLCVHCRQPIGSGNFHTEEGQNYCEKDWQALFQTKCYGCQFPIEPGDRWVEALSQNWHSECFNCSTCQVNLEGQPFYAKGGRPYCKRHAGGRY